MEREHKLNFGSVEDYAEELEEHDILCSRFPNVLERGNHLAEQLKEECKVAWRRPFSQKQ